MKKDEDECTRRVPLNVGVTARSGLVGSRPVGRNPIRYFILFESDLASFFLSIPIPIPIPRVPLTKPPFRVFRYLLQPPLAAPLFPLSLPHPMSLSILFVLFLLLRRNALDLCEIFLLKFLVRALHLPYFFTYSGRVIYSLDPNHRAFQITYCVLLATIMNTIAKHQLSS
jgi:hypothetical protein